MHEYKIYELILRFLINQYHDDFVMEDDDGVILVDDEDTNTRYRVTIDIVP